MKVYSVVLVGIGLETVCYDWAFMKRFVFWGGWAGRHFCVVNMSEKDAWQMLWRYSGWVLRRVWKWRSISVSCSTKNNDGGGGISNLMKLHLTDRKPKDQEICRFDSARYPESQTSGLRQRLSVASLHDLPFQLGLQWMRGCIPELEATRGPGAVSDGPKAQGLSPDQPVDSCTYHTTRGETNPAVGQPGNLQGYLEPVF